MGRRMKQRTKQGFLEQPLAYGDEVLVGGVRGKTLGGGWVDGVVQMQHPSGRVTVRIRGRNHVVSRNDVVPKRLSFTVRLPAELGRPQARRPLTPEREALTGEHWWVDDDEITIRDEHGLIVAVAAGPEDAQLIARAPHMQHAIQRALERLEHETGAPLGLVIAQLRSALSPARKVSD
jgi:hypothetical protein